MNVPIDLNSRIDISPKNLAKMAPSDKENIAFKVSVYAVPSGDGYQEKRFDLFLETSDRTGVPLYVGEWNNVVRTREGAISKLDPGLSELTKSDAKKILGALKKAEVWGTAFWRWDYQEVATDNFNLVSYNNGTLVPTKYLGILEDTVETIYGSSSLAEKSNEPADTAPASTTDTATASNDFKQTTNGTYAIFHLPELDKFNDEYVKPENIALHIGQIPNIAVGNSNGDLQMFQYASDNNAKGKSLILMVHHDDPVREYSYDKKAEKVLEESRKNNWNIISMKDDFKDIYPIGNSTR